MLADNAAVQYHPGMAYLKIGDRESAKRALRGAVNAPQSFAGKDEAKKVLAQL